MSEIKVNSVVNSTGDNDSGLDLSTNDNIKFKIANAEKAVIDANGNMGVGTTSPTNVSGVPDLTVAGKFYTSDGTASNPAQSFTGDTDTGVFRVGADNIAVSTGGSRRMSVESDGDVFIGKTTGGTANVGVEMRGDGLILSTRDGDACAILRRNTSDGEVLRFQTDANHAGQVGIATFSSMGRLFIGNNDCNLLFNNGIPEIFPCTESGAKRDNAVDLGNSSARFDDIRATNGTIQTSDENEKQDIASVTSKELNVAKKLSALFKTFRWKDKVSEKGDKARTHTGIVAQEVQTAFKAEGLDASNYGLFTSDTWWEKEIKVDAVKADEEKGIEAKDAYTYIDTKDKKTDGYTERTRLGVRYPELFSFIFSSIEARLTALESK